MAVDKEALFKPRLPEEEVDVPGVGAMRVRGLSRAEVVDQLNEVDRSIPGAFEARIVAMSLVEPSLTDDEVQRWRAASPPDEIGVVVDKINELSALTKQAVKDAYEEFESDPDVSFRALPGGEAGDDGGADAA